MSDERVQWAPGVYVTRHDYDALVNDLRLFGNAYVETFDGGARRIPPENFLMRVMDVSHGFHLFMDGDAWCAVGPHFQDLATSPAGFGSTTEQAVDALHRELRTDPWWDNKALPPLSAFAVHTAGEQTTAKHGDA
jgi:hypothetical protein